MAFSASSRISPRTWAQRLSVMAGSECASILATSVWEALVYGLGGGSAAEVVEADLGGDRPPKEDA